MATKNLYEIMMEKLKRDTQRVYVTVGEAHNGTYKVINRAEVAVGFEKEDTSNK